LIGDSIMLGAKSSILAAIPGAAVDAVTSRQYGEAINVVQAYKSAGVLPFTVVVHLGPNGRITDGLFDQLMETIGPGHRVYFLTARVPRSWESEDNATLHRGQTRWGIAHVLEWRDYAGCHDDWFVNDGFHLQTVGQHAYANFIKAGLLGKAPTKCVK